MHLAGHAEDGTSLMLSISCGWVTRMRRSAWNFSG